MSKIHIKDLKISTCHGCFAEEKINPQPFIFDCTIDYDFEKASQSDNLEDTLDYGSIMHSISDFATQNTFNLIETLCYHTASMIMQKYPVEKILLTVRKPQAPVDLDFGDVSVSVQLERTPVILSLGSNMGDKKATLETAIRRLSENPAICLMKTSSYLENPPYGGVAKNTFVNCAVLVETYLSPESLLEYIHLIEKEAKRERTVRWGDRTLDIDIVFYGNKIIDSKNIVVPHNDYENRDFVLIPVNEICPDWICPLHRKRIKDILADLLSRQNNSR